MWTPEYFLRYVELPLKVDGVTIPNNDGTFDIYINALHTEPHQKESLEHELRHLKQEHFYLDLPLSRMERQADGEPLNVVLHPPQGKVPCFYSESALAHWLRTVAAQQHIKF